MRALFLVFFSFLLLIGSSGFAQSDGTNQLNENGKKTGTWKGYYPNGSIRYEGQFKNDEPYGVFKYYFQTGEVQTIMKYTKPNEAYVTHYYSTGDLMAQGKYLNKLKDSVWVTYGADNMVVDRGPYRQGEKFGRWRTFHLNGMIAEEVMMEKDLEQDTLRAFYDNGRLKQESVYKDGFLHGLSTFYDPNGNKVLKGLYYMGRRDKKWIYYGEKLKVEKELIYDKGKLTNPEVMDEIDYDKEEFKNNRKEFLEYEDLRRPIRYE